MDSDCEYGTVVPARKKMKKKMKYIAQNRRMEGLSYVGYDTLGDTVTHTALRPPRQIGPACDSKFCEKSKNRNCKSFLDNTRKLIFKLFWKMSWEQKRTYVCNLMMETEPKQRTKNDQSEGKCSVKYFLHGESGPLQVCRKMFLSTLGLKEKMIRGWRNHSLPFGLQEHPSVAMEKRKIKYAKGERCLNYYQKELALIQFLNDLPKLDSHYCRKDTSKLYFEDDYQCKSNLYREYVKKCEKGPDSTVSLTKFMQILKKFNYALHKPRKDQCDTCTSYKVGNITTEEYKKHRANIDAARTAKENDLKLAMEGLCLLLCIDTEAVKLMPQLKNSLQYYKMKLKIHNVTIYNILTHESTNYVWDESNGELVASIFTTIVIHHLQNILNEKGVLLPVIIYSDGCGYQNRNMILSNALSNFSVKNKIPILQKYLEKGHTQMECDSSHALIERRVKNKILNLPSEFAKEIKNARTNPFPLEVVELSFDFFKNYDDPGLSRYSSIRPGSKAGDPKVNDLRVIKYDPDGSISFKITFADEYQKIPHSPKLLKNKEPEHLYVKQLPICEKKYKHLQDLKEFLPESAHSFYDNLKFHHNTVGTTEPGPVNTKTTNAKMTSHIKSVVMSKDVKKKVRVPVVAAKVVTKIINTKTSSNTIAGQIAKKVKENDNGVKVALIKAKKVTVKRAKAVNLKAMDRGIEAEVEDETNVQNVTMKPAKMKRSISMCDGKDCVGTGKVNKTVNLKEGSKELNCLNNVNVKAGTVPKHRRT